MSLFSFTRGSVFPMALSRPGFVSSLAKKMMYSSSSANDGEECGRSKPKKQSQEEKIRSKTPVGKLAEQEEGRHPFQEKEPLKPHPGMDNLLF